MAVLLCVLINRERKKTECSWFMIAVAISCLLYYASWVSITEQ